MIECQLLSTEQSRLSQPRPEAEVDRKLLHTSYIYCKKYANIKQLFNKQSLNCVLHLFFYTRTLFYSLYIFRTTCTLHWYNSWYYFSKIFAVGALLYHCCNSGVYLSRRLSSEEHSKPRDSSRASSKWWCYDTNNAPGKHDRTIFLQIHSLLSKRKKMILHLQLQYLFLGMTCLCRLPLLF